MIPDMSDYYDQEMFPSDYYSISFVAYIDIYQ